MPRARGEEDWARAVMSSALGTSVAVNDDGSQDGMFDLKLSVGPANLYGAAEVTAAADPEAIEAWNIINGSEVAWTDNRLAGGWLVALDPSARMKRIRSELPIALKDLEQLGITQWRNNRSTARKTQPGKVLADLRVRSVSQGQTSVPGSIYPTLDLPSERSGGQVPPDGDAISDWVESFLSHPQQADVLGKLTKSGLPERHVFIFVPGFTSAPWPIPYLLMQDLPNLPDRTPVLPHAVTHVWVMSTWNTRYGVRWCPTLGWTYFAKSVDGARMQN